MQRLNRPRPDIRICRNGRIDIHKRAAARMGLDADSRISFFADEEQNLYIRQDKDGLHSMAARGKALFRYHSAETARAILSLPDVPAGMDKACFRIGDPDDGRTFPVITRMVL